MIWIYLVLLLVIFLAGAFFVKYPNVLPRVSAAIVAILAFLVMVWDKVAPMVGAGGQ